MSAGLEWDLKPYRFVFPFCSVIKENGADGNRKEDVSKSTLIYC